MDDRDYERYIHINLPHARTIVQRIGRSLVGPGAFPEEGAPGELHEPSCSWRRACASSTRIRPRQRPCPAADAAAAAARLLVEALLETPVRGDRLGQNVRNLFECLGLSEEGATLSLQCGERPDSPLR